MQRLSFILLGAIALAGCAGSGANSGANSSPVMAVMQPTAGNSAAGTVGFRQQGDQIMVAVKLSGLPPGLHGFHIHEKGDCSAPDATSAGGHFNPTGQQHGDPMHAEHHGGDFGNLTAAADGTAVIDLTLPASQVSLSSGPANSIIGRGLIVHSAPDDFMTQPTGNSGARLACGVIAMK